tara:strand:+ start:355 stop:531 length:177 start_codon:yes stop_codon:yes gene_type:complete
MKSIYFGSKEENNTRRDREFLALSPSERVKRFLELSMALTRFESISSTKKGNFILKKD